MLLAPLGRGGMGQVWEARDDRLDRTVAVKLMNAAETGSDRARRFNREATVTAGLSHPCVPAIYDLIAEHGQLPAPGSLRSAPRSRRCWSWCLAAASSTATSSRRTSWSA